MHRVVAMGCTAYCESGCEVHCVVEVRCIMWWGSDVACIMYGE